MGILVPIRTVSALIDQLEFNMAVVIHSPTIASLGALFRNEEFHRALGDGVISSSPTGGEALARAQAPAANIQLNFKRYSLPFLDAHLSALNSSLLNSRHSLTEFADSTDPKSRSRYYLVLFSKDI